MNEQVCRNAGLRGLDDNIRNSEAVFHELKRREYSAHSVVRVNTHNGFARFESDIDHSHRTASDDRYNLPIMT